MRSIGTRVVVAVLTVITAFSLALAYNARAQRQLVARLARVNQSYVPATRLLDDTREELRSFSRALSNRDPIALRQSLRATLTLFPFDRRCHEHLRALSAHLAALADEDLTRDERAFVSNVGRVVDQLALDVDDISVQTDALLAALDEPSPRVDPELGRLGAALVAFEKRVSDLREVVDDRTAASVADVRAAERDIVARVVAASAAAALFAIVVVVVIARSLRPIRDLTQLAASYKRGDYDTPPVRAGNDEIGVLARELGGMASAIRDRDTRLRQQHQELEEAYAAVLAAQRAQVQAERLAAVGELAARVTHELRNPLSSIGLNAEMLADELHRADVGDDARSMVDSIGREVARLAELTERYLSMARSDDPKREPTDVGALVDDAVRRLRAELLAEGVTASVVCDGTVQCSVDDPQLRQVVVNLVRNAVQALRGSEDKRIRVVVAPTAGRGATVTVEDSGPGVQADMAARLFEPFVSGRDGGTGLGLSISRRIARRHGGDLTAGASLELGGAMFTLSLEPTAAAVREATEAADSD